MPAVIVELLSSYNSLEAPRIHWVADPNSLYANPGKSFVVSEEVEHANDLSENPCNREWISPALRRLIEAGSMLCTYGTLSEACVCTYPVLFDLIQPGPSIQVLC